MMLLNRTSSAILLSAALAAVCLVSLPHAFAQNADQKHDGKTIFEQKCLKCHKPEKFQSQHNDRKGWELILSRMERNSCVLSEDEQLLVRGKLALQRAAHGFREANDLGALSR